MEEEKVTQLNKDLYWHVMKGRRYPRWRGNTMLKMPADIMLYHQVIFEKQPDFIIETGTKKGGSTIFLADMMSLMAAFKSKSNREGHVVSIDIAPIHTPPHDRITYIKGSSVDDKIIEQAKAKIQEIWGSRQGTPSVMVILDSDHSRFHVKWELHKYRAIVTPGQYMVVEDCYSANALPVGPKEAMDWFLSTHKNFVLDPLDKQFIVTQTRDGWLRRVV